MTPDRTTIFLMSHNSTAHGIPTSGSSTDCESLIVYEGVEYCLDPIHNTAVAVSISDSSAGIAKQFIVHDRPWVVLGIGNPVIGQRRTALRIPDSIKWITGRFFHDSFLESFIFGHVGVLRVLDRFSNCMIQRITVPSFIEVIASGAFEDCCLLSTIDFRSCKQLRGCASSLDA
jgi:hypothetical protein